MVPNICGILMKYPSLTWGTFPSPILNSFFANGPASWSPRRKDRMFVGRWSFYNVLKHVKIWDKHRSCWLSATMQNRKSVAEISWQCQQNPANEVAVLEDVLKRSIFDLASWCDIIASSQRMTLHSLRRETKAEPRFNGIHWHFYVYQIDWHHKCRMGCSSALKKLDSNPTACSCQCKWPLERTFVRMRFMSNVFPVRSRASRKINPPTPELKHAITLL